MNPISTPASRRRLTGALALMALLTTPATAQETGSDLGRLFLTPEHRKIMDRQRQQNIQEEQDISTDPALTINGIVTRSSGKRTAWINGRAQNENEIRNEQVQIPNRKEPGKVLIKSSESPTMQAKVGETVNRGSGESSDLLDGGRIDIRRKNPISDK